jgi:hypothetical protein
MNDICGCVRHSEFGGGSDEAFGRDVGWPRAAWRAGENSQRKNRGFRENVYNGVAYDLNFAFREIEFAAEARIEPLVVNS